MFTDGVDDRRKVAVGFDVGRGKYANGVTELVIGEDCALEGELVRELERDLLARSWSDSNS